MRISLPIHKPTPSTPAGPAPWFHLVPGSRPLALVLGGSRLFEVDDAFHQRLRAGEADALQELRALEVVRPRSPEASLLPEPLAISLNLAQVCNLASSYCYADEGRFGSAPRTMSSHVALQAIDRLVRDSAGRRVTVGFIGGEPFLHRSLLHACVEHGARRAREASIPIGFSVATNGTLLTNDDVRLLRSNEFAVSVSMDGGEELHDRHRTRHDGSGSYAKTVAAVAPLLADPGRARVAARATVTRDDLRVADRVSALLDLGFLEVGVSPARSGPDAALVLQQDDWPRYLDEMIHAAEADVARMRTGVQSSLRFSNFAIALKEIHRGSCRSLPCGSAQSYVSVGADGGYYTCHRTIGLKVFALGNAEEGPSAERRRDFVDAHDVDRQVPCRSCWARYLCGGGCHAEVAAQGRGGCDYIRGWLEFCLATYSGLLQTAPHLFTAPPEAS